MGNSDQLNDVWDGLALRPLCGPGRFFSDRCNNMALSLSTDGVPLYKSSPVSLWPVYLTVLNLPPLIRNKAENVILCGLWVGPVKPEMNILLDPIAGSLKQYESSGIVIKNCFGNFTVRAKLVMGVFDLPAKAAVLCAKQFNGKYGCSVCLHPGKRLSNNSRVYLPDTYPDRTHKQVLADARKAQNINSAVNGIIGMSPLSSILDLVASVPIDYMHAVLEGETRWLLKAWFESKNHNSPFYVGRQVKKIDIELLKQRPPNEFSRPPRSISKHVKFWKASELRNWLLYYSLPLLLDFLPSLYWHHFALLVCAMHILLSESITHAQIEAAEQMLNTFHRFLPELYGESSCTANAHLLSHLTKYVKLWGPLWTHSAFGFENKNGKLKHLFHGKSDIVHQLLFNVDVCYTLQQVQGKLLESESGRALEYINSCSARSNMISLGAHTYVVGKHHITHLTPDQSAVLGSSERVEVFYRLFKDGVLYYCTSYNAQGKRDNTYCCYLDETSDALCLGQIELFIFSPKVVALVRQIKITRTTMLNMGGNPCRMELNIFRDADLLNSYITPIHKPSREECQLSPVTIGNIVSKAVIVSVSSNHYCIKQPNHFECH